MQKPIEFLLIDDDLDDQEIFLLVLNQMKLNFSLNAFNDGKSGLQGALKTDYVPDYIFLDLNMPKMNGRECLTELRKIYKLSQVPVYIYSTSTSEKDQADILLMGATGFFTKPSSTDELAFIISGVIKNNNNQISNN